MIGSIRWNVVIGVIAMVLTFCVSISHNLFLTSLLRSIYSFIFLFVLSFLFRWVVGTVVGLNRIDIHTNEEHNHAVEQIGNHVNISTPEQDDELQQLLKQNMGATDGEPAFSPLTPPKLASKDKLHPQDLADVIRHMSEE